MMSTPGISRRVAAISRGRPLLTVAILATCSQCSNERDTPPPLSHQSEVSEKDSSLDPTAIGEEITEFLAKSQMDVKSCADALRQNLSIPWNGATRLSMEATFTLLATNGAGKVEMFSAEWPTFVPEQSRTCITEAFLSSTFHTDHDDFRGTITYPFCIHAPETNTE